MFPNRVSRLIIDGVSNLHNWYNEFQNEEDITDTDKVFTGFIEECFKAKEACPLISIKNSSIKSSDELKSYIYGFLETLKDDTAPIDLEDSYYIPRRSIVAYNIVTMIGEPKNGWLRLATYLALLLESEDHYTSGPYFDSYVANKLQAFTYDALITIKYNDNWKTGLEAPVHGLRQIQNYTKSKPELSVLLSRYLIKRVFEQASWSIPTTHIFHPQYYPQSPRVKTSEPMLVISTTWDPVCPLISAKKSA